MAAATPPGGMMDCCCAPVAVADSPCPECGAVGRSVDRVTLDSMLLPAALARVTDTEHRFCATPSCPVVYFGAADRFRTAEVRVPVFQKLPAGDRTVCYCFAIGEREIGEELALTGRSTAVERISDWVKEGRCACERENPQGTCCLGNVAAVIRYAEGERNRCAGREVLAGDPA